jgi:hypothetical protein
LNGRIWYNNKRNKKRKTQPKKGVEEMEKALKNCLREQEEVCWQGVPVEFPLLDSANTRSILLKWILTVAIAGGIRNPI